MYALTVCMWLKSNASPGVGTPFSYAVPGQANELVLIEWGNNPMEILINDKVYLHIWFYIILKHWHIFALILLMLKPLKGCKATFSDQWWEVASYLCDLDHSWWCLGSFPRWCQEGEWRESGTISSYQTSRPADPRSRAGKCKQLFFLVPLLKTCPVSTMFNLQVNNISRASLLLYSLRTVDVQFGVQYCREGPLTSVEQSLSWIQQIYIIILEMR